jgi:LacI family transcriptional regulator, galactose operon repressor
MKTKRPRRAAAPAAPKSGQPVTLKMLAARLGLSPASVSLVINDAPGAQSIPAKTQERIRAAAREMGYRPNQLARSLRSRRSFTVGILVPEVSEGYAATVLSGADAHLVQESYFFLVASHRNRPERLDEYFRVLMDRAVEGFLLINTPLESAPPLPTVVVAGHRKLAGVTNVVIDHDRAALLALTHLAELGHEQIAFFKGHKSSADTEHRWGAIQKAARALRLEVRPELTLQLEGESLGKSFTPDQAYEEGYVFGRKLLDRGHPFTALFAFNDISAIGAMRAFREAGRHVPDEVSVVGFDDIQSAAFQNPGLTTVRQPLGEMGEMAARTLLRKLAGEACPPEITVSPQLVVRESTGPAAGAGQKPRRTSPKTTVVA